MLPLRKVDQVASRQEGLAAYCAGFDAEAFRDTIAQWRAATATLYRLMGQGSFKKRFAECKGSCPHDTHATAHAHAHSHSLPHICTQKRRRAW
jgi:hypothetical protein